MTVAKKAAAKKVAPKAKAPAPNFAVGQKLSRTKETATIVGITTRGEWIIENDGGYGYPDLNNYTTTELAKEFQIIG